MRNVRVIMSDFMASGLAGLGGALIADPDAVLGTAGQRSGTDQERLLWRMLGVRDLTLGALLFSAGTAAARRTVLRLIAGMCAVEVLLLTVFRTRMPWRAFLMYAGSTALAGVHAAVASQSQVDIESREALMMTTGYALAVPATLKLAPAVRQGKRLEFAAFELGATLIAAGWWRRGNRNGSVLNAFFCVATAIAWMLARRKAVSGMATPSGSRQ